MDIEFRDLIEHAEIAEDYYERGELDGALMCLDILVATAMKLINRLEEEEYDAE